MSAQLMFRCDCDGVTGFGHFSRCLSLARTLISVHKAKVLFYGDFNNFAKKALQYYGICCVDANGLGYGESDINNTLAISKEFDSLVIDSYETNQEYVSGLVSQGFNLILMDDVHIPLMDFSGVDLVINTRAGSELVSYPSRKVALGLGYMIIKPELRRIRIANLSRKKDLLKNVLVFFSGREVQPKMLEMVIEMARDVLPDSVISCITGDETLDVKSEVRKISFRPDIEELYAATDFIITGGGLVKYESAYCDIPNVALSQTDLQDQDTTILASRNLTYDLGMVKDFNLAVVTDKLRDFVRDKESLYAQHNAFQTAMHTDSTQRLASLILSL
jgi:spore coat polysaccharide biosynthesis predicted glycosyltransferase SpsG